MSCQPEKTGKGRGRDEGGEMLMQRPGNLQAGTNGGKGPWVGVLSTDTREPLGHSASESVPRCRRGWCDCEAAGPSAL